MPSDRRAGLKAPAPDDAVTRRDVRVGASFSEDPHMALTDDQLRILRDIEHTTPISDTDTDWAVHAGYAALAEDGDIDLTQTGREALAADDR